MKTVSIQCFSLPIGTGDLPRQKKLLSFGANPTTKGLLKLGQKTRELFAANQHALGFDRVAIDFEHNTLPGTQAYKDSHEPRPVAAYASPVLREDGLWLDDIRWTPIGIETARNYEDLSPAPGMDPSGEVLFLHSAGLCRNGAVYGVTAFSANDAVVTETRTPDEEKTVMDKILQVLRKGLNLDEKADESAIAAALEAIQLQGFSAKFADIEKRLAALTEHEERGTKNADGGTVEPFSASAGADLVKKLTDLEKLLVSHQRDDLVAQAAREGKVIPLTVEQIAATDLGTLKGIVEKLESTVPLEKRTPVMVVAHSVSSAKTLTDAQKQIAKRCGVDEKKLEAELNR